jgi:hypothetical protein
METWIFEPGHTEAEFRARHMMVTWVRGLFKDITAGSSSAGTGASTRASTERSTPPGSGPVSRLETSTWQRRLLRRREPSEDHVRGPVHGANWGHDVQARG